MSNREPKVSIIIPVYNGAKYVKCAIDSALRQTYKNIEILVVDDGPKDNTEDIVKSYGNKVRYIKKENGGVSSALNLALKEMKGQYFSWLSHDDTYEPNKVEVEVRYLIDNGLVGKKVILFSDYYLINSEGKVIGESIKDHDEIEKKPEYCLLKGHINGLSLLIPKSAFDECGEFDTDLVCTQDYEMWRLMFVKGYRFIHIPECLVSTRWHAKQVTNTNPKVMTEGNDFYINLIKATSKTRMEELEGSEYCFLMELADFYKTSVYKGAEEYCRKRAQEIFDDVKDEVKNKKVSVIIPFYNRSKVVIRAIKSVLKQEHDNYEIILVDDGSSDNLLLVKDFIKGNKKIKLVRNAKNCGASASRNRGIREASGDYIAFLDSDDEFAPNKLQKQIQYMIAGKARFSHTSYERNVGGKINVMDSGKVHGHCGRKLMYNCPIATPTVMLDREWFVAGGYSFREDIEIGEDTCLWLELMKDNVYLIGIDEPLSRVNVGDNAAAYTDEKQIVGLKEIIKYLINDGYYSQFDYELSKLMSAYVDYVKKSEKGYDFLVSGNMVSKFLFFMKQEGFKSAAKRTGKKIRDMVVRGKR